MQDPNVDMVVATPERVAFEYRAAGPGSRFVAQVIDLLVLLVVMAIVIAAASAFADLTGQNDRGWRRRGGDAARPDRRRGDAVGGGRRAGRARAAAVGAELADLRARLRRAAAPAHAGAAAAVGRPGGAGAGPGHSGGRSD